MGKAKERLTMNGQIHKAYKVLLKLAHPKYIKDDQGIPLAILKNARGIAFVTIVKAGFVFSGTVGSGIVIAKQEDGTWSGPSSLGVAGMGWGAQIGGSVTDSVIILNTKMAVATFTGNGQVKFGGNVSIAAGPLGREADAAVTAGDKGVASCYSYSHSRGLFAGLSLQGAVMATRHSDNERFYGRKTSAKEILRGMIQPPPNDDLNLLYSTLNTIISSSNVKMDLGSQALHNSGSFDPMMGSVGSNGNGLLKEHGAPDFPYATDSDGTGSGGSGGVGQSSSAAAYGEASQSHATSSNVIDALPVGWTEVISDGGQPYYWNEETGETTWEKPKPIVAAPPAVPAPPVRPRMSAPAIPTRTSASAYAPAAAQQQQQQQQQHDTFINPSQQRQVSAAAAAAAVPSMATQAAEAAAEIASKRASAPSQNTTTPYSTPNRPTIALPPRPSQRVLLGTTSTSPGGAQPGASNQGMNMPTQQEQAAVSQAASHFAKMGLQNGTSSSNTSTAPPAVMRAAIPAAAFAANGGSKRPAPAVPVVPFGQYTYEDVSARQVYGLDTKHLEKYLRDADFKRALGMGRETFEELPSWRKEKLKKDAGLW